MHWDLATPTVWVFLLASRLPVPEAWSPSGFRPIVCYPFSTVLLFPIQDNERKPIVLKPRGCKTCPVTSTHIQLIMADWGTCHFICREPETETLEHLRMCWLFFYVLQCTASCAVAAYQPQTSQTTHLQKCRHSIFSTHSVSEKKTSTWVGQQLQISTVKDSPWKAFVTKHST